MELDTSKPNSEMKPEEDEDADIPLKQKTHKWRQPYASVYGEIQYKVHDKPPPLTTMALAIQHFLSMSMGIVSATLLVLEFFCMEDHLNMKTEVLGTVFFTMGIATLLQTTVGVRLPIVQGATTTLWLPSLATLSLPQFEKCDAVRNQSNGNSSSMTDWQDNMEEPLYRIRLQAISGMILCAGVFQMLVGLSGAIPILLRLISPLVITTTIFLIGFPLLKSVAAASSNHWGIALMTCALILIFGLYLAPYNVPLPWYNRREGFHWVWCGIFRICPVVLALLISWIFCVILTATNVFPLDENASGYKARTDIKFGALAEAHWFWPPYPGQFGPPRPLFSPLLGFFAGAICSIVESVGDYSVTAKVSQAPPLPGHVISRGIFIEGVGGFLAGLFGAPLTTTSYSENIATIAITKVASRRIFQCVGVLLLILGCFKKFSAVFVSIPTPIMGGVFMALFSMLVGVGLAPLQCVQLNSSRNMFVIGISLCVGYLVPDWMSAHPQAIQNLGSQVLTDTVNVLLRIPVFVGGSLALFLDNTIPGSEEERGMKKWRPDGNDTLTPEVLKHYELKCIIRLCEKYPFFSKIPIFPSLRGHTRVSEPQQIIELNNEDV